MLSEFNAALRKRLRRCHYCGQELPNHRLNVRLSPLKAHLFDLIQRGGIDGVPCRDLQSILEVNANTLKAHVSQINETITGSGYRIYSRGGISRLVQTPPPRKRRNS